MKKLSTFIFKTLLVVMFCYPGFSKTTFDKPGKKVVTGEYTVSATDYRPLTSIVVKGTFKSTGPHEGICRGRKEVCGFRPEKPDPIIPRVRPLLPREIPFEYFIFSPDYPGPFPAGTFMNQNGQMQRDHIIYKEEFDRDTKERIIKITFE